MSIIPVLAVIDDWENHLAEDSNFQTMAKRLRASFLSKVRARGLRILSSLDNHIVPIQWWELDHFPKNQYSVTYIILFLYVSAKRMPSRSDFDKQENTKHYVLIL